MSHGKQFTLYTHASGPNGWKVAVVLEELGLTYQPVYLDFGKGEHKAPEYTKFNPNGRIPAIVDHKNGDLVLWESGAILTYLVDKYDTNHKISATAEADKYKQLQWLFFQASGQGPYFGQYAWFAKFHPEKVPSAVERYKKEIERVFGVLEGVLSKQEWLVAGKPTVADREIGGPLLRLQLSKATTTKHSSALKLVREAQRQGIGQEDCCRSCGGGGGVRGLYVFFQGRLHGH